MGNKPDPVIRYSLIKGLQEDLMLYRSGKINIAVFTTLAFYTLKIMGYEDLARLIKNNPLEAPEIVERLLQRYFSIDYFSLELMKDVIEQVKKEKSG